MQLNVDKTVLGATFPQLINEVKMKAINILPSDITAEQIIQLYFIMYPYIASEFVHRKDLADYTKTLKDEFDQKIDELNNKLSDLVSAINSHSHPSDGATSLTSFPTPELKSWNVTPDAFNTGESNITNSSGYTQSMPHRNPETPTGVTNQNGGIQINEEYVNRMFTVPFDIDTEAFVTGANPYIQSQQP